MNQTGKQQDHIPPFIHNGTVAEGTPHFARQLVLVGLCCGIIPLKIVMAMREVDVVFVENGGPLERCGYKEAAMSANGPRWQVASYAERSDIPCCV